MASHYNISGSATQELLAAGDNTSIASMSLVNLSASNACTVDLYIEKLLTGSFYILKNLELPVGVTLILEGDDVKFNNKTNQFGLYIKLTQTSGTPEVDVIIN